MAGQRNYQKELDRLTESLEREGKKPRLFLHSCCAPCSSYVLEYLSRYFSVTVFYYNPNISPEEEYRKRVEEQKRLIRAFSSEIDGAQIDFREGIYDPETFYAMAKGLEDVPEGGDRCFQCYELRLREAASLAKAGDYDYFCTTLSISPMKNAEMLMDIGDRLAEEYGVSYLPSNFKKKNGYKRSVELSAQYGLYRQDYCGCVFSRRESEARRRERERIEKSTEAGLKSLYTGEEKR